MRVVVLEATDSNGKSIKVTRKFLKKKVSTICESLKTNPEKLSSVIEELVKFFKGMEKLFVADQNLQKIYKDRENTEEENDAIKKLLPDNDLGENLESLIEELIVKNKKVPDSVKLAIKVNFIK